MSGTKAGAAKVRDVMLAKYGKDYYVKMGQVGGKVPRKFYHFRELKKSDPELLKKISSKGGNSRLGKP